MNVKGPEQAILETRNELIADGVIVCVRQDSAERAEAACRAALAGGLRILEITLTTPGAIELIGRFAREGGAIVGAGTVLDPAEVERVAAAGGCFALSPIFDADVMIAARNLGLLYIPGAATPREIMTARRAGCALVKVFPAGALGGPNYLRAIRGPLPGIALIPTSGPDSRNMNDYIAAGAAAVGVGGELFPPGWTPGHAAKKAARSRAALDRAREKMEDKR